jgi:hypothetical protein
MQLFVQFDIPPELSLPFQAGSHLNVLMCPVHNEIPSFNSWSSLPPEYWKAAEPHWYASLFVNSVDFRASANYLAPFELVLADAPSSERFRISVGGVPDWVQDPEEFICCCGAHMQFVAQISDGAEFPKLTDAPEQPDSSSANDHVLFLGNEVYIFACSAQCNPRAVWVTVQN